MLPGSKDPHHRGLSHHCANRDNAATQCFAKNHHVGNDAFVLALQCCTGATKARLNLIKNHQHVAVFGELANTSEIALWRHDDSRLALNGL